MRFITIWLAVTFACVTVMIVTAETTYLPNASTATGMITGWVIVVLSIAIGGAVALCDERIHR